MVIPFRPLHHPAPVTTHQGARALRLVGATRRAPTCRNLGDLRTVHARAVVLAEGLREQHASSVASILEMLRRQVPGQRDLLDHAERVAGHAADVAAVTGLGVEAVTEVARAAALHDLGRLAFPDGWLEPGPLADDEAALLRLHPVIAREALEPIPGFSGVADIVAACQERFDGTGYPAGLSGAGIPIGARILAVADAFDAMTAQRVLCDPLTPVAACAQLVRDAGARFDPDVVHRWLRLLDVPRRARLQ